MFRNERFSHRISRVCVAMAGLTFMIGGGVSGQAFAQTDRVLQSHPFHSQGDHVFNDFIGDIGKAFQRAGLPMPSGIVEAPPDVQRGYRNISCDCLGHNGPDQNSIAYGQALQQLNNALKVLRQKATNANQQNARAQLVNVVDKAIDPSAERGITRPDQRALISKTKLYMRSLRAELAGYSPFRPSARGFRFGGNPHDSGEHADGEK